ncbi:hypothetical protein [Mastigocoleus testarum]|uniref:hypothetical protein n=1 Tax=Mastigocoleus testarum TaxID=996925 RepID=UPI00128EF3E0|nr:hypothetical protein [Mastigocoleus testarum]
MRQIDFLGDVAEANADALTALQHLYRRICCNDLSNWYYICPNLGVWAYLSVQRTWMNPDDVT